MTTLPFITEIHTLQLILKVSELCNINCTYCYYYNIGLNPSHGRPPYISEEVSDGLIDWIARSHKEYGFRRIEIALHGGEPLLIHRDQLAALLDRISSRTSTELGISPVYTIQTNATLVNESWIRLFSEHKIHVGVSIDGDKAQHDKFRLDKRSRSSFENTIRGLNMLLSASAAGRIPDISTISVIQTDSNYRLIYRFLRSLGIKRLAFLLPDLPSHQSNFDDTHQMSQIARARLDILIEWLLEGDPEVHVRQAEEEIRRIKLGISGRRERSIADEAFLSRFIAVLHTDGTIALDDTYMAAPQWYRTAPEWSVYSSTLRSLVESAHFQELRATFAEPPEPCRKCKWARICRGGDPENRHTLENGFKNRSSYCSSHLEFYACAVEVLQLYSHTIAEAHPSLAASEAMYSGWIK